VFHFDLEARGVGGAAEVEHAAGVVRTQDAGTRRPNVVKLARDNPARHFGMVNRRPAAEATAHFHLGQIHELNPSAL
jgi:hypothetical protein